MEMKRPSDLELIQKILIYRKTGNLEPFLEIAGIWAITFARDIFKIRDGLESEMYFIIKKKGDECIRIFKEESLIKFPHFFNKYCKHLVLNMIRVHRKSRNQSYLSLWNEEKYENPEISKFRNEKFLILEKLIQKQPPTSKIIICLRFNFILDVESRSFLEDCLFKQGIEKKEFYKYYFSRQKEIQEYKGSLLKKLNSLNRRIFHNESNDIDKIKKRKKQISSILEKPDRFYTYKEIGQFIGKPQHRVIAICNDSIKSIQGEIKFLKAA